MKRPLRAAAVLSLFVVGCGPSPTPPKTASDSKLLPDLRTAKDRPSVALVVRDGDPAGAIAVAVATGSAEDDPEIGVALAGMIEGRLAERGLAANVTPAWDGYRVVVLVATEAEARAGAETLRAVLGAAAEEKDLAAAKKKLVALAARPLRDPALARWARCVGSPFAKPTRGPREELTVARLEQWRAAHHGTGRVAFGVAADARISETVASTIIGGPAWPAGAAWSGGALGPAGGKVVAEVYEAPPDAPGAPPVVTVHATLDVGTSSAAVAAAEALGDRRGPLATRLAALDLPFRLREVDGGAHARGGCIGVVLEASVSKRDAGTREAVEDDLAARVADAVALVNVEARVHLTEGGPVLDGRALARRAGDAREASERAAWWTLVDVARPAAGDAQEGARSGLGVALGVPMKKAAPKESTPAVEPAPAALAAAVERASATYDKPALEGRSRVEPGQGEAWVLVGSPCGTEGEAENDTGLSLLATLSTAFAAKSSPLVKVEPWIVPDGAGLVVHGPALPGESPAAHARRLADVAARSFAAEPLTASAIALARAEAFRQETRLEGDALATLATVLAPARPSSVVAWGHADAIARASDAAILARAQALRTGPLRVAVVANVDAAQAEAAVRAADRWIDRAAREAKACRGAAADRTPPQPGTYALASRPPASPEAILAFPFEGDGGAAQLVAEALAGGLLERALASSGATAFGAKIVGTPRAPAIVLRISSAQDKLDEAVMQARALVARIHESGLAQADYDRAIAQAAKTELATALDPGARVVALFRGEDISGPGKRPRARPSLDQVRAFAQKQLGEDAMIVVASRPPRITAPATAPPARKP